MTTKTIAGAFVVEREVRIQAPRETVFPLIATREGFSRWMPVTQLEPRVGGSITFAFAPESGGISVAHGEITAFKPPEHIAFTWNMDDESSDLQTEVSIDLIAEGNATLVRLTHTGFADEKTFEGYNGGWVYFLDRLQHSGNGETSEEDRHSVAARQYLAKKALLAEEIALKDHVERVAAMRRTIPLGPPLIKEYSFTNDAGATVALSELFGDKDDLIVYHLMFAPDDAAPCPMCSMWIDGLNAVAPHIRQRSAFAVIAKAPIEKLRTFAAQRGWDRVRVLSSNGTDFQRDYDVENALGEQMPAISAFHRKEGNIYHFYQKFAELDENNNRGIDLYSPVWNLFDLLPGGRGDWYPNHDYMSARVRTAL